jgi:hypothetical protein
MYDDDTMLERLARALAPPAAQPSWSEVQAVRRATAFVRQRLAHQRSRRASSPRSITFLPLSVTTPPTAGTAKESRPSHRVTYREIRFLP